MTRIPLIFGGAAFGEAGKNGTRIHTLPECQEIIDVFVASGHGLIDTSNIYGGGTSQQFLAQLDLKGARIDTKLFPLKPGDAAPEPVRAALQKSIKDLGPHKINVLYLHAPDRSVPFEDTLREINELYKAGYFKEFGLSNFNSWEVAEVVTICKYNGWITPTVYQGLYNAVERAVEVELIPALRKYGLRFYAYSPLGAGLLAGIMFTVNDMEGNTGSRWDPKTSFVAGLLRERYEQLLPLYKQLYEVLEQHNMRLPEAALRWLQHHSVLGPTDGVVIGARNVEQLKSNISDSEGGPLPEDIVTLLNEAWRKAKPDAPHYSFSL